MIIRCVSATLALASLACCSAPVTPSAPRETFTNPILEHFADPQAFFHDGRYYVVRSIRGDRLELRATRDITALATADARTVWTAPPDTDHSKHLWAPEIHRLSGAWYIYYAADDGDSDHHHMYVLENTAGDPMTGAFTMKARLKTDPQDNWAIDGTVFEHRGSLYMAWSGWPAPLTGAETANIYIARMSNPWTLSSERVLLSTPEHDWERNWKNPPEWNKTPGRPVFVNEGPAFLTRGDRIFLSYSASGCWTPTYAVGLLSARADADPLDPKAWTKSAKPLLSQDPATSTYGAGHNSFLKSPDGSEDWIIYHASDKPNECGGYPRSTRMQRVIWNADGFPEFGPPAPRGQKLEKPSGTPEIKK